MTQITAASYSGSKESSPCALQEKHLPLVNKGTLYDVTSEVGKLARGHFGAAPNAEVDMTIGRDVIILRVDGNQHELTNDGDGNWTLDGTTLLNDNGEISKLADTIIRKVYTAFLRSQESNSSTSSTTGAAGNTSGSGNGGVTVVYPPCCHCGNSSGDASIGPLIASLIAQIAQLRERIQDLQPRASHDHEASSTLARLQAQLAEKQKQLDELLAQQQQNQHLIRELRARQSASQQPPSASPGGLNVQLRGNVDEVAGLRRDNQRLQQQVAEYERQLEIARQERRK